MGWFFFLVLKETFLSSGTVLEFRSLSVKTLKDPVSHLQDLSAQKYFS